MNRKTCNSLSRSSIVVRFHWGGDCYKFPQLTLYRNPKGDPVTKSKRHRVSLVNRRSKTKVAVDKPD